MKKQFGRMLSLLVCLAVLFAGLPVLSASATQETLVSAYPVGLSLGDFNAKVSVWSGPSADGGASCDLTNGYLNMPASAGRQSSWSTATSVFSLTNLFAAKEQIALSVWAYAEDLNADQDITFNLKDGKGATGSVKLPKANLVTKANTWCETVVPLTAFTGSFNWQDGLQQWSLARTGGTGTIRLDQLALVKIPYNTYPVKKVLADDSVKVSGSLENTVRSLSGAQSYYFHSESTSQKPVMYGAPSINLSTFADSLTDLGLSFFAYTDSLSVDGQYALEIASGSNWSNILKVMGYAKKSSFLTKNGVWQQVVIPFTQEMATAAFDWTDVTQWRLRLQVPSADGSAATPDTLWVDQVEIISVISPDQVAADEVIELIDALDGIDDIAAIQAARDAFDALTNVQKDLVTNRDKLVGLEASLKVAAIGLVSYRAESLVAIQAAEAVMESLSDSDKAIVTAARAKYDYLARVARDLQKVYDVDLSTGWSNSGSTKEVIDSTDPVRPGKHIKVVPSDNWSIWKSDLGVDISSLDFDNLFWAVEAKRTGGKDTTLKLNITNGTQNMFIGWWYSAGLPDGQWGYVTQEFTAMQNSADWSIWTKETWNSDAPFTQISIRQDSNPAEEIVFGSVGIYDKTIDIDALVQAANAVVDQIAALDETDAEAVAAARAAYDALNDGQKKLVVNAEDLFAAEEAFKAEADKAAAQTVVDAIAALNVQTLDDKAAVEAARAAYEALTDAQKALVTNLERLENSEAAIAALQAAADKAEADAAAAQGVTDAINALNVQTLDDKAAVEAARTAYDALTDDQKALVAEDVLAKLTAAEETIADLEEAAAKEEADKAAAQAVTDAINALPAELALTDKAAVVAARTAYDALTDAQKALVANLERLENSEAAIAALQAAADKAEADAAAAQGVTDVINALPEEIVLTDKAAVEAVRAAFEALTDDQKALVAEDVLAKLTAAEETIADLEEAAAKEEADKAAAQAVTDAINALPEEIALTDKADVEAARAAFDALTEDQKALVDNLAALEAAEAAIDELQAAADKAAADKAAADAVIAQIDALEVDDLDDKAAVEAARAAYDALTDAQKALVAAETVAKLTAAEDTIADLEQQAADAVAVGTFTVMVDALNEESSAEAVEAARAAYEALTEAQKAKVAEETLNKLVALEDALAAAADAAAAQAVTDAITALTEESTEEAVVAARAAYDALTDAQKALVANETLEKLVALEEKFQEPEITFGDVDGNGKVDAADALKALQHAVKLITLEGDDATAADVNGDDKIDATDALLMLQYTVKLIDKFPVEEAEADDDTTGDDTTGDDTTGDDTTGDDTTGDEPTGDDTTGDEPTPAE